MWWVCGCHDVAVSCGANRTYRLGNAIGTPVLTTSCILLVALLHDFQHICIVENLDGSPCCCSFTHTPNNRTQQVTPHLCLRPCKTQTACERVHARNEPKVHHKATNTSADVRARTAIDIFAHAARSSTAARSHCHNEAADVQTML